jgi:hypothetical protein
MEIIGLIFHTPSVVDATVYSSVVCVPYIISLASPRACESKTFCIAEDVTLSPTEHGG